MPIIYTSSTGNNAPVFHNLLCLYARPMGLILDATYGAGGFWNKSRELLERGTVRAVFMDIQNRPGVHLVGDAMKMPFADQSFHMVVLDPPYVRMMGTHSTLASKTYGNSRDMINRYGFNTLLAKSWGDLMRMYGAMVAEAKRVLMPGGVVLVKGQDDSRNFFVRDLPSHGMKMIDCHIVTRTAKPMMRHKYQVHARRNHSYFVVLRKTRRKS